MEDMDAVSSEELVLVSLLEAESGGSEQDSVPLSTVTEVVTSGEQQLGNQVEIAVAVSSLAEQGYLRRETKEGEEYLELTDSGHEKARSTHEELVMTEIEVVDGTDRETLQLGEATSRIGDSMVEVAADCTDDGIYYLREQVPSEELVGRDSERDQSRELFEDAYTAENGRILVLSGPSGVGKTTLVDTVLEHASEILDTVRVHCQEAGSEPYQPLRAALDQIGAENPFASVGVDAGDPEAYEAQQTALFHDVTTLLTVDKGIRVLFLDDIDHADAATWTYIEYLIEHIHEYPLVLVGTHQPGTLPDDAPIAAGAVSDEVGTRLTLRGLNSEDTRTLVAQLLSRRDIPEDFVDAIYQRTEGNPLFVETTIDTLLESNQLDPDFQWYPDDEDAIDLPDEVNETILQRLESLDTETRSVIEWVAIAGEFVPVTLVEELVDIPAEDVRTIVETLVDVEVFNQERDRKWITIRNDVVREAILGDIDPQERTNRHEVIAETLAAKQDKSESIEQVSTLGYHYQQAGNDSEAIEWYQRAADQATAVYAHETARDHYHTVLDIARSIGADDVVLSAGHDLAEMSLTTSEYDQAERYVQFVRERLPEEDTMRRRENARLEAEIATKRGEFVQAITAADEGLALTEEPDETHCGLLAVKAEAQWRKSEYDDAEETCQEYRKLATELGDASLEAEANEQLAMVFQKRSEYDKARTYYQQALEQAEEIGDTHHGAKITNGLGIVAQNQGEEATAQEYYEQALETFEEIGDRHQAAKLYNNLGISASNQGDMETAKENYEKALEIANTIGDRDLIAGLRLNLGAIESQQGNIDAARSHAEEGLDLFQAMDSPHQTALATSHLASYHSVAGEYGQAKENYNDALEVFMDLGDSLGATDPLWGLGRISRSQGNFEEAAAYIEESAELLADIDNPNRLAMLEVERASLASAREQYDTAYEYCIDAKTILESDGRESLRATVQSLLGYIEIERENYEVAREHLDSAREMHELVSGPTPIADVDREYAHLAIETGEYDEADERLTSALETFREAGDVLEVAHTRHQLGRLAAARGNDQQARESYEHALDTFETVGADIFTLDTLKRLVGDCGDHAPDAAIEWCDRGIEIASGIDAGMADEKRVFFEKQRQQFS
jgi:tetratricopeptide (TPR) repeat protein